MSFTVKVCGITRAEDAYAALKQGVDFIGINGWANSPRCVATANFPPLLDVIPAPKRVFVDVQPDVEKLNTAKKAGFHFFQIHFDPFLPTARESVAEWQRIAGRDRLWLAPRVPPGQIWQHWVLEYADTLLFDGHRHGQFGGTGHGADLAQFKSLMAAHPRVRWILAGGLGEDTIATAWASGARFFDLNSAIEIAPGIKDPAKLVATLAKLRTLTNDGT